MSVRNLSRVALFAALMAICSWVSIPTPVPFTLQTFAVFLAPGLLGGKMGTIAVGTYLLLGAVGLPVFAGFFGWIGTLLGATGGYLLGFLLTALVIWLAEIALGTSQPVFLASALVGQGLCYLFGSVWYALGYAGGTAGLPAVLSTCVLPFLLPDTAKLILAWSLRKRLAPVLAKSR